MADVASRLGASTHSLYKWMREAEQPVEVRHGQLSQAEDLRRLKSELKRVTEERDVLKKGHSVRLLCHVMRVHPSHHYAWKTHLVNARELDNQRLLSKLKQTWLESGGIYGYSKIMLDMRDMG